MDNAVKKTIRRAMLPVGLVLFLIGVIYFNALIEKQSRQITAPVVVAVATPLKPVTASPVIYREVTRTTLIDPSREYQEHIFFGDGSEIARWKSHGDDFFEKTGMVPNGKVLFKNRSQNTSGVEEYYNNHRSGQYHEYYDNGKLKRQAEYARGKPLWSKDYFYDGILRMEVDYQDAMWITNNKEVGVGKVYRRNGSLMYEWRLTNAAHGGYNRSYNGDGKLVQEKLFDQNGEVSSVKNY